MKKIFPTNIRISSIFALGIFFCAAFAFGQYPALPYQNKTLSKTLNRGNSNPLSALAYQQHKTQPKTGNAMGTNTPPLNPGTPPNAAAASGRASNETYAVISAGDEIKVVLKSDLKNEQKRLDDEYKHDTKRYQDSKKDKNNHDATAVKKPDKKDYTLKILKSPFKTKEDAQKFAEEANRKNGKTGGKKATGNNNW